MNFLVVHASCLVHADDVALQVVVVADAAVKRGDGSGFEVVERGLLFDASADGRQIDEFYVFALNQGDEVGDPKRNFDVVFIRVPEPRIYQSECNSGEIVRVTSILFFFVDRRYDDVSSQYPGSIC